MKKELKRKLLIIKHKSTSDVLRNYMTCVHLHVISKCVYNYLYNYKKTVKKVDTCSKKKCCLNLGLRKLVLQCTRKIMFNSLKQNKVYKCFINRFF